MTAYKQTSQLVPQDVGPTLFDTYPNMHLIHLSQAPIARAKDYQSNSLSSILSCFYTML